MKKCVAACNCNVTWNVP